MEEQREIKSTEVKPNSNYKDKYVHLIGQEAAEKAAKKTETNKSYGFGKYFHEVFILSILIYGAFYSSLLVPSENKRDNRTIEDVQAEIQAKKKFKLSQAAKSVDQSSTAE